MVAFNPHCVDSTVRLDGEHRWYDEKPRDLDVNKEIDNEVDQEQRCDQIPAHEKSLTRRRKAHEPKIASHGANGTATGVGECLSVTQLDQVGQTLPQRVETDVGDPVLAHIKMRELVRLLRNAGCITITKPIVGDAQPTQRWQLGAQ